MNTITTDIRRDIADAITISGIQYSGRFTEHDFLSRLYNLNDLPSNDRRYGSAYKDIMQHMYYNKDWPLDWVFYDNRFNLINCDDSTFLKFISETIHPSVRDNEEEIAVLLKTYNSILQKKEFAIIQTSEISGKPVFNGKKIIANEVNPYENLEQIKEFLNFDYVSSKVKLMNTSVSTDTDLAIGTAKELIETICKSILNKFSITIDRNWDIIKLVKETNKALDLKPKEADNPEAAERSTKQILGGISTIIQGIAELRNAYGSGHGKEPDFIGLEAFYAKLVVGTVSQLAIFYLNVNGEKTELVE